MTLETFFEKFDLFADAPDAVAKMRELVLQLAVQGRLVERDPGDEPADKLLEQIQKSKERRRRCPARSFPAAAAPVRTHPCSVGRLDPRPRLNLLLTQ